MHPLVSLTALAVFSPSYLARHALKKLHLILWEDNNDNMMVICRKKRKVKAFFSYFTSVARSRLIWTLNKSEPNLRSFYPPPPSHLSISAPFHGFLKLLKATRQRGDKSKECSKFHLRIELAVSRSHVTFHTKQAMATNDYLFIIKLRICASIQAEWLLERSPNRWTNLTSVKTLTRLRKNASQSEKKRFLC